MVEWIDRRSVLGERREHLGDSPVVDVVMYLCSLCQYLVVIWDISDHIAAAATYHHMPASSTDNPPDDPRR